MHSLSRRTFLAQSSSAAFAQPAARPNILFCIADDWSHGHAGAYGDRCVSTPTFDRVAKEGVLFTHSFCAAPSCTPSRAGILTGQAPHRLEEGGNDYPVKAMGVTCVAVGNWRETATYVSGLLAGRVTT